MKKFTIKKGFILLNRVFLAACFHLTFLTGDLHAQPTLKTTVADGDWLNPNIWSPVGVPLSEGTVIINHDVTIPAGELAGFQAEWLIINSGAGITGDASLGFSGNLKLYGLTDLNMFAVSDGDSLLVYGTILGNSFTPGNIHNFNYSSGSIHSDTLVFAEVAFKNYGSVNVKHLAHAGLEDFVNHTGGSVVVADSAVFYGPLVNEQGATMEIGGFITTGNILNNGDISCENWTQGEGAVNGATGRFCVDLCLQLFGTISGTVDICDATPSPFGSCDIALLAVVAPTVTNCQQGVCATVGISEYTTQHMLVSPNPTMDMIQVSLGTPDKIRITDASGRQIYTASGSSTYNIDLSAFASGTYFIYSSNTVKKCIRL